MHDKLPITEDDLQAYADGRLAEERRAAVEAWLAARPHEAERVAAYRHLRAAIRAAYDPMLHRPVPKRLEHASAPRLRWRMIAAAAGLVLLAAAAGWQLHDWRSGRAGEAMAQRAAIAHATYASEVRHPVEVGADQEEHLVAWLSKRLGMKIRAPKLEALGMSLVGGRLLADETGAVALLMYQNAAGQRVTIYIRGKGVGREQTGFRYVQEKHVSVFYWIDEDWACAVASADVGKNELQRIAEAAYKQLES